MDTIQIKDDEIDVEEIVCKIRENIKKRKESGAYTKEMEALINEPLQAPTASAGQDDIPQNLNYINSNWDVHAEYSISSHRPLLGRFLVWGRKLVHGEVRRYVDLIAGKQSEFNTHVARILNSCIKGFDKKINDTVIAVNKDIDAKVNGAVAAVNRDIDAKVNEVVVAVNRDIDAKVNGAMAAVNRDIDAKVNEVVVAVNRDIDAKVNGAMAAVNRDIDAKVNGAVATVNKDIDAKVNEAVTAVNKDIENKAWLANILDKRIKLYQHKSQSIADEQNTLNINYFVFNENIGRAWNKLSGISVQGVPSIFEDALNIFDGCKNILEIGCGNGTFLQMLKDKGIRGYGIDTNEDFILYCKRKELDVEQVDASMHLKSLQDKTLDGVFAAHVIEHMQLYELKQLLELCYTKMQFGSHIILVTPNILNITVSSNTFYMDPTHLNHIHPDVIKFLLESCGFRDIQERFYQPVPDEIKFKKIEYNPDTNEKKIYETINYNIDLLNNLLFGFRDFAVIAKK